MSNLQRIRREQGLSQSALARKSGVSVRLIQDYEQGHKNINRAYAETVRSLSAALDTTMEKIMEDE